MEIFIFADSHYGRSNLKNRNRYPRLSLEKLKSLEGKIRECDAVICLGDLTDDGKRSECKICLSEISDFLHSVSDKVYALMGNHDCINFSEEQFYTFGRFENRPPFILSDKNAALVFIDSNYLSNESRYLYTNVDWTDSVIPQDQTELISQVLNCDADNIYLFMHQCLAPDAEKRHRIRNYEEVHSLLSSSNKNITVIQGHYHYGANAEIDGVKYITLPALCVNDTRPYMILDTESGETQIVK